MEPTKFFIDILDVALKDRRMDKKVGLVCRTTDIKQVMRNTNKYIVYNFTDCTNTNVHHPTDM